MKTVKIIGYAYDKANEAKNSNSVTNSNRDVLNNVNPDPNKNADLLKNMIYRISDHYRHMAKTVNVFNVHAACLEPSNSPH